MCPNCQPYATVAARIMIGQIFIIAGIGKIADFAGTAGYMASKHMPAVTFFLVMAILFEVLGGISLLAGFKARLGALALIVFLLATTLIFHNFWALEGVDRQMQMIQFMKNLAILGGLLMMATYGSGPISLDTMCRKQQRGKVEQPDSA